MYNHKKKDIRFFYSKLNIDKDISDKNSGWILFLEKNKSNHNLTLNQIKKSFFLKNSLKYLFGVDYIAGGSIVLKKSFEINFFHKLIDSLFKKSSCCIITYNSIYWTLNKILALNLKKNNFNSLISLLFLNINKTFTLLSPFNKLLYTLKNIDKISNN